VTTWCDNEVPLYPNAWVRIQRLYSTNFNIFRSDDGVQWAWMGEMTWNANWNPPAMPDVVYVGPEFSPEVGNYASDEQNLRGRVLAQMRNYGDTWPAAPVVASRTYSIGMHFGAQYGASLTAAPIPTLLAPTDVAGIPGLKQRNWNNDTGTSGSGVINNLVADVNGTAVPTTCSVNYNALCYWTTQGQGETNAAMLGADQVLMNSYLDMNADPAIATVTITGIPAALTTNSYDVYVYIAGSVAGRGGGYHILNADTGAVLKDWVYALSTWFAPDYYPVPDNTSPASYGVGNYIVFRGLSATNIVVQASTENGLGYLIRGVGTHRAPINNIQLVAPTTATAVTRPTLGIARVGTTTVITFTGHLYSASSVKGPWTVVSGATSPYTVPAAEPTTFFRAGP
jgi:hypothetical protein